MKFVSCNMHKIYSNKKPQIFVKFGIISRIPWPLRDSVLKCWKRS